MNAGDHTIESACFWYPFRPWLRWPIRLFAIVAMLLAVTKLVIHRQWSDAAGLVWPSWLLVVALETPQPKPKTTGYYVGATLAWVAVLLTLLFLGLWIFGR
jgi:hypothetical protein